MKCKRFSFLAYILIFVMVVTGCSSGGSVSNNSSKSSSNTEDKTAVEPEDEEVTDEQLLTREEEELISDTYLVEEISTREERIILKSLSTGRRYRFAYGLSTQFLDKWGNRTSQTDFVPGSIVEIGKAVNNVLSTISLDKDAWVVEDLTNFSYDRDREIFVIGNTKYRMRPSVNVFSGDLTVTMNDVTEEDHIRVSGIGKEVLSVSVTTGHGYIALINTGFFKNSMISIGKDIYTLITKDTVIPVSAGSYKITVAKNGYGGSTKVKVKKNDTVTIDLNSLKGEGPKKCRIIFKTSIDGVKVRLDGKKVPCNKRIEIDYGQHKLKVSVPDYETWQKTLLVNSPKSSISLDPKDYNKDESKSADSLNSNNTGNQSSKNSSNSSTNTNNSNNTNNSSNSNTGSSGSRSSSGNSSSSSGSNLGSSGGSSSSGNRTSSGSNSSGDDSSINSATQRSSSYSGNDYGRSDDEDDEDDDSDNIRSGTSNGTTDSVNSSTEDARQQELDYLDTLSNMITQLTDGD